uniref:Uncharacterized protein n=1 Tax=Strigamia maritima TaxID=126957 RepID=T1J2D4_STRMM
MRKKLQTEAGRRIEALIRSRQTNWAEPPSELTGTMRKLNQRVHQWNQNKIKLVRKSIAKTAISRNTEFPADLFSEMFGELRAAESRKRMSELKLDIKNLRDTRCKYLINLQANAITSIRLKRFLYATPGEYVKPISRLFTKSEKQRVEEILHCDFEMLFGRQNW